MLKDLWPNYQKSFYKKFYSKIEKNEKITRENKERKENDEKKNMFKFRNINV